jgi:hypothetical protein
VLRSVLDAIKMGLWDFEPPETECSDYDSTDAMPGTDEKVRVLADRVRSGMPLWHPWDRDDMEKAPHRSKPR